MQSYEVRALPLINTLRRAMAQAGVPSLQLYPEGRPCTRPTTHRLLELFESIQRHEIRRVPSAGIPSNQDAGAPENDQVLVSTLTPVQCHILELLAIPAADYGR